MKLRRLCLQGKYKGLADQIFDFSGASDNVIAFIGLNGSGKSQLLELIAESFAYLERAQRVDFKVKKHFPFTVKVEYEISPFSEANSTDILSFEIERSGSVNCAICKSNNEWISIPIDELHLPKHVVGYSSGLNENLQRSFLKNALQYYEVVAAKKAWLKRLRQINADRDSKGKYLTTEDLDKFEKIIESTFNVFQRRYPGIFEQNDSDILVTEDPSLGIRNTIVPRMVFLDYDCNALLMFCLGILTSDELDTVFPDIAFNSPSLVRVQYDLRKFPEEVGALLDIRQLIEIVGGDVQNGLAKTSDEFFDQYELEYLAGTIEIDFSNVQLKERLRERYFNDPKILFEKLYKIQLLGVGRWQKRDIKLLKIDNFFGNVKKPLKTKLPLEITQLNLTNGLTQIEFDDLSDGEAQLIQVQGAAFVFRKDSTLFLFDEPETHLNPSWRTNFHRYLNQALVGYEQTQVVLSTHSPFLISSLRKENVFRFERSNSRTEMSPIASETFGASFDVLIKKYFSLKSTISQSAVVEILAQLNDKTLTDVERSQWLNEHVGESMEKAYLLRKLSS